MLEFFVNTITVYFLCKGYHCLISFKRALFHSLKCLFFQEALFLNKAGKDQLQGFFNVDTP